MREIRLALTVPCTRDWKAGFGSSILGLVRHLSVSGISGVNMSHFDMNIMQGTSVLPRARQLAVEWAKKSGATYLLCIDDDMQFQANIVDTLMGRDVDIVACNYIGKGTGKSLVHGLDGQMISSEGRSGIEEVGWVGFGLVLIKLDAIKDIPVPLFETRWMEERQDFIGEDFYFCMKVRQHGIKIYCDHDASRLIKHIGDYGYGYPAQSVRLVEEAA